MTSKVVVGINSKSWYSDNSMMIQGILKPYVQSIENNIEKEKNNYFQGRKTQLIIEDKENGIAQEVEYYQGMDNSTFCIEDVIKELFPNLQRRSALITLFSFFEVQLDVLCLHLQSENPSFIAFENYTKYNGIDGSTKYLQKIAKLPIDKSNSVWGEIIKIKHIRNNLVHNDGKVQLIEKKHLTPTLKYIEKCKYLDQDNHGKIIIKEGYLNQLLNIFDDFFRDIDKQLLFFNENRSFTIEDFVW